MSIKLKTILDQILKENTEEKTYEVNYWYRYGKDGDEKEQDDIEVKASSESEAIKKAKDKARKGAISSSFEVKVKSLKEDTRFDSLQENEEGLRSQLHTLVGNEMRLGKRVGMTGASHHEEEHKKAEKAVEDFLRMNPSMEEYRDKVEDHFTKLLFR